MTMGNKATDNEKRMSAIITYTASDMVSRVNGDNIKQEDIVNILYNGSEFVLFYFK